MNKGKLLVSTVSLYLQLELRKRRLDSVAAVEAAGWLDASGILKDSSQRPGLPFRELLRNEQVLGKRQESNKRWFVDRVNRFNVKIQL